MQARSRTAPMLKMEHWLGLALGVAFLITHVSLYFAPIFLLIAAVSVPGRLRHFPIPPFLIGGCLVLSFTIEGLTAYFWANADFILILRAGAGLASAILGLFLGYRFPEAARQAILIAGAIVLISNTFFWIAGIEPEHARYLYGSGELLSSVGLYISRVSFFFSQGINAYGTLAGLLALLFAADARTTGRPTSVAFAILALAHVLMTDSRGAFFVSIVSMAIIFSGRGRVVFIPILIASIIAPFFLLAFSDTINDALAAHARIGTDVSTGRIPYWERIIDALSDNWLALPFGVGLTGANAIVNQIGSIHDLAGYINAQDELPGAHNIWIQALLEGGLFKVALIVTVFVLIGRRVAYLPTSYRNFALCAIYVPLIGVLESTFDWTRFEIFLILFAILGICLRADVPDRVRASRRYTPA